MPDRLLDIGWLRVFETVGRLGNLTRAAAELGLSQPSVSHRIRTLEAQVGTPLLRRLHRGTELTEDGRILFDAVSAGVDRVDEATRRIRQRSRKPGVRLYTDYGFASYWLMPRVAEFRRSHPGVEVHIVASQILESDLDAIADTGVMFGAVGDFESGARLLMPERVVPVCSPRLVARLGPLDDAAGIATAPLLHLDSTTPPRWLTWSAWFAEQGIGRDPGQGDLGLNTYSLVIQAAMADQGIALGWMGLVDAFLDSGTLVAVGPELTRPDCGYWLVPTGSENESTRALNEWLLDIRRGETARPVSARPGRPFA